MPPVEAPASHYFVPDAARAVAAEIRDARGVEVFLIGRRGPDGLVHEVEAHAYGSNRAVPVLLGLVRPGEVIIHNHPSGNLEPSEPDLEISSTVGQQGVGSYIVDNACTRVRLVVRPHDPKPRIVVEPEKVSRLLGPGSSLAQLIGEFEDRPQQREMASSVVKAFNNDGVAVIEAGTGTGKSIAYLVPAILYALENKEKIVVSTATINLQEQVLHKDLPVVRQAIDRDFRAELVKGRSNYVCKRKADFTRQELSGGQQTLVADDMTMELREVLDWASQSESGDIGDLAVAPRPEVWERVVSESDNCLRVRCRFYEACFFYNSRRRAARADVIVVNHSLLLSDLAVRRESKNYSTAAVLPPYKHVILDEAHHLEETATRHFGGQVARSGLRRSLGMLLRTDAKGQRGILVRVREQCDRSLSAGKVPIDFPLRDLLTSEIMPATDDARDAVDTQLGDLAWDFLEMMGLDPPRPGIEHRFRLTPRMLESPGWRDRVQLHIMAISECLAECLEKHRRGMRLLADLEEESLAEFLNHAMEWRALVDRVENARRVVASFMKIDSSKCQWIELAQDKRARLAVKLCDAPIEVAPILRESLHDKMRSEVLTSATLTVAGQFEYLFHRIGLGPRAPLPEPSGDGDPPPARSIESLLLPAPFDYRKQVFLGVPTDLGDPRSPGFDERLGDLCVRAISASGGRAFVLFTSWGQMKRVHAACAPLVRRQGIECLVQGEDTRDRLLRKFRADETSVLFATSSFWEGVDVRGRALELLIIAKLPFAVPNDPITEAQVEALQRQGKDSFNELVVPRAIIRLKQGFGRLIRAHSDRGAVIIGDERVVRMGYGRRFLDSLPDVEVRSLDTAELVAQLEAFYAAG